MNSMKRLPRVVLRRTLFGLAVLLGGMSMQSEASAQGGIGFGFQPFGFYQPYGAQYRSSIPNPPYFATNPPVYYGTRHFRPYGVSPFASPPVVSAGNDYRSQVAPMNQRRVGGMISNPYICKSDSPSASVSQNAIAKPDQKAEVELASIAVDFQPGKIQSNPFVLGDVRVARK